jgi:hypothetical protein
MTTGECRRLCRLKDIDPALEHSTFIYHGGHGTLDLNGAFYFATFGWSGDGGNVMLTRVNPRQLKLDLGYEVEPTGTVFPATGPRNGSPDASVTHWDLRGRPVAARGTAGAVGVRLVNSGPGLRMVRAAALFSHTAIER